MRLFQLVQSDFENDRDTVLVQIPPSTYRYNRTYRRYNQEEDYCYEDDYPNNVRDLGYTDPDDCGVYYFGL